MNKEKPDSRSPSFIQSLERGLAVIRSFGDSRPQQTLSDVARVTDLDRATARRFLLTLQKLGYVEADGRYFRLTPRALDLGYAFLASLPWWPSAQRVTERVAEKVGWSCAVGVLDRQDVTYVAYATASRFPVFQRTIGTKLPAYVTAIGRVLIAGLGPEERNQFIAKQDLVQLTVRTITEKAKFRAEIERVRKDGYCLIDQELQPGLRSIGVPVLGRRGTIVAGLSISIIDIKMNHRSIIRTYLRPLKEASKFITEALPT